MQGTFLLGMVSIASGLASILYQPQLWDSPLARELGVILEMIRILAISLPLVEVTGAFLFRGGWALRMCGLTVVRRAGRRASRLRCAYRTCLVWLPILALFCWIEFGRELEVYPQRGPHDVLAGTYVVPR
jgi:hypothetical protein